MLRKYFYGILPQAITLVMLLLVTGLFWKFAVLEEGAIQADSSEKLDGEQLTFKRMDMELGKARGVVDRYKQNLDEIAYFRREFLTRRQERMVAISRFLEARAREHRIVMDTVDYDTSSTREKNLDIHIIRLPLAGRYRDIRGFIADVEQSDLFLIITELSLDDEAGNLGTVEVQLSLATYFQGGPS